MTSTSTSAGTSVLTLQGVSKWFGDVVAVSDVSFSLAPGVTGLLGPNGAGKTSVLRMACGLTRPSTGTVRLFGVDPRADPDVFRRLGLVPQTEALPEGLTAREFVRSGGELGGLAEPDAAARTALDRVGLSPEDSRRLRNLSGGERQRAKIAQALVHDPELLVMDEPLEGLDPRQRAEVLTLVRSLGAQGRSVLVSSHVLDEVERMSEQVVVVARGRLVAEGDFRSIRALMDDRPHRVRVGTDEPRRLAARLALLPHVLGLELDATGLVVQTADLTALGRDVVPAVRDVGCRLRELVPLDDDLDSVFRYLVGER